MYPPTVGEIQDFQLAADYNIVRKSRGMGVGSIVWGAINLFVGWLTFYGDIFSWLLLLLGFSLIVEGTWICFKPSPKGFLVDGIFLLIIGVWNIVITINDFIVWSQLVGRYYYLSTPSVAFITIGVMQIFWSVFSIKRYQRFSKTPSQKPDPNVSSRVDEILESMKKAKPREVYDLIEFTGANTNWKGRLFGDVAVLAGVSGWIWKSVGDVAFVPWKDFQIVDKGRYRLSKFRSVQINMGNRVFNGVMKPEAVQRYQQVWSSGSNTYPPPPPPPAI
jgi:hypothetical protein